MKTNRRNYLLRTALAGLLFLAGIGMALMAAKTSGPPLLGKSDAAVEDRLEASRARGNAIKSHFQTRLGLNDTGEAERLDGPAQEAYDNRAYPNKWIEHAQREAAASAANAMVKLSGFSANATSGPLSSWQQVGPNGVFSSALVANESTAGTAATFFSGRVTAIAISPNCSGTNCKIFVGSAGGGVWAAGNALASQLNWHPSNEGIPSNAIGSLAFDPTDATGRTLYVGTGEPNGSGDSEAGVGLYKSTNFGQSWALVSGSASVATGRSIGAVAVDPADANHIFIGTAVARHGSSSVNGGRFTPPASAEVGLYESFDAGATFFRVLSKETDNPDPGTVNGNDFFRGGVSHLELYRASGETQVYASLFDYGVFRRSKAVDGNTAFHKIFASAGRGTVVASASSRTEFSLAPNGSKLRIYVGDAPPPADFWRVNNANVPADSLVSSGANVGWTKLSNPTKGTPGYSSFDYCTGQCNYDMPVYSPPGHPDIVYIGGAMQYDEIFTANRPSNGRAVQRSDDAGVHFTDMTIDAQSNLSIHPDQHAIATLPSDPNTVFIGNDGGMWRINSSFTNVSSQCNSRGLTGDDLKDCRMWLSKIPTSITSLNRGLGTLQFQSLSLNVQEPLTDIMGGTQDNGTQAFDANGKGRDWFVTIFGDGGQSGINPFDPSKRFHTYFDAQIDENFHGTDPKGWDWISDPFFIPPGSSEPRSFYIPIVYDPKVNGSMFTGLTHVWRTQDNGGDQAYLDSVCNEFTGTFASLCGDWVPIGQDLSSTSFGTDKAPGQYIVATERAPSDNGTLWAGLRRGRLFVTSNANVAAPGNVAFYRIDTAAQPTRFVSGISIDKSDPNHAFVSYSGYNAYAAASGTATGHVFEVTYHPNSHAATWSGDLAGGEPSAGGLGDQPVTDIAVDWNTGDIYVSTDFGVFVRKSGSRKWQPAASNLPPVAVYGLTIDVNARVLYAATHGRGAWSLRLP